MKKTIHEIRDPIHVFIKLDSEERKVLNSKPFQRLRCIHQLAMTYLLYPGATHRRFEHSLGVMELADRVFSVVTDPLNLTDCVRDLFPGSSDRDQRPFPGKFRPGSAKVLAAGVAFGGLMPRSRPFALFPCR